MEQITEIAFTKAALPYGWLGNMAACKIVYNEVEWKSTEALFQALRFHETSRYREEIRQASNGFTAKLVAKAHRDEMYITPCGDEDLANMRMCLRLKVDQHPDLKDILIKSDGIPIYEDVTKRGEKNSNLFWGAIKQADGSWKGQNIMGVLWMELRDELIHGPKAPLEIERRFLLKSPPNLVDYESYHIDQFYLSEKNADTTERIRRISYHGVDGSDIHNEYYHTIKKFVDECTSEEIEKKISKEEFNKLQPQTKRFTQKNRFVVKDGDLKWELDRFACLYIAEIEIPHKDYEVVIPEWLAPHILMEVTGMKEFSNSNLAE